MKRPFFIVLLAAVILALVGVANASMIIPAADPAKEHAAAPEKSPAIGDDWDLDRVDFVHYAKPGTPNPGKPPSCYKLMGIKWSDLPVNYAINPANPYGLSEEFVNAAIASSAEIWDAATSKELFNDAYSVDYSAAYGVLDQKNAIVFGDYADANAIAVTSVWYTRKGGRIVEFDMIFNTKFSWGDAETNPSLMDLRNIATHELGHSAGLADIYTSSCSAVTMYGYSNYGDMEKRTLELPDIAGLTAIYGN